MLAKIREHSMVVAYVILTLVTAATFALAQHANAGQQRANNHVAQLALQDAERANVNLKAAVRQSCEDNNATNAGVLKFIQTILENSRRGTEATLLSPLATELQKEAAQRNLQNIQRANDAANAIFTQEDCAGATP